MIDNVRSLEDAVAAHIGGATRDAWVRGELSREDLLAALGAELARADLRAASATSRSVSPGAEALFMVPHPVLDHGSVTLVGYMGTDEDVVNAARTSYQGGTKRNSSTRDLIRYLVRHRHTTPLEMCEIQLLVRLPLFVAAQWVRHRTAVINAESSRYSVVENEFYLPSAEQLRAQSSANKQGRGDELPPDVQQRILEQMAEDATTAYDHYRQRLSAGLTRELAARGLSQCLYTTWVWKCDLHNLMHFLRLRLDEHAQWEIRQYAETIAQIVRQWVPLCHEAFVDYRLEAREFSRGEVWLIGQVLADRGVRVSELEAAGLSPREVAEFFKKFDFHIEEKR